MPKILKRFGAKRQKGRKKDVAKKCHALSSPRGDYIITDYTFASGAAVFSTGKAAASIRAGTTLIAFANNFAAQQYREESARSPQTARTLGITGSGNKSVAKTSRAQPITSFPNIWTLAAMPI